MNDSFELIELVEYIYLRGKQLKENEKEAESEDNIDKLRGRRKEIERLLEIINTDRVSKELDILMENFDKE